MNLFFDCAKLFYEKIKFKARITNKLLMATKKEEAEIIYKPIVGYEKFYGISKEGDVKSFRSGIILKKWEDGDGYYNVTLYDINKEHKTYRIHRLSGITFYNEIYKNSPKINESIGKEVVLTKYHIDHYDGDKLNNHILNLRFVIPSENGKNAHRNNPKMKNNRRRVIQYDLEGNYICEYSSVTEVALLNEYSSRGPISKCCSGKTGEAYGYIWKYADDKIINSKYIPQEGEIFMKVHKYFDYELNNYEVSNYGNVRNIKRNSHLKPADRGGYDRYSLYTKNGNFNACSHQLAAYYFNHFPQNDITKHDLKKAGFKLLDNDPITLNILIIYGYKLSEKQKKLEVHHGDENKKNNYYINLEWMIHIDNSTYSCGKSIIKCDKRTSEELQKYNSIAEASRDIGNEDSIRTDIIACLRGRYKTARGYKWKYADSTENNKN